MSELRTELSDLALAREQVLGAARAGLPPYDGTHRRWLAELSRMSGSLA